ncbi:MAG TPA: T9SS type A sorting domain-containing protein, partial [bacterium]
TQGDFAYFTAGENGFYVIDIANPSNPIITGHCDTPEHAWGVDVAGEYAYVADRFAGLRVISVADPSSPIEVGSFQKPSGAALDVRVSQNVAYMAYDINGMVLVDVSDPFAPVELGSCNQAFYAHGVDYADGYAVVACSGWQRLYVVDVSDPAQMVVTGYHWTEAGALGVSVIGGCAYVVENNYLEIYDISAALPVNPWETTPSTPSSFRLHPCHPNPFNPTTILSFDLPVAGLVKLEVFDINGRAVLSGSGPEGGLRSATPTMAWLPAGTHQITFDGSDLPSGIYLARMFAGEFQQTQKLVLLK